MYCAHTPQQSAPQHAALRKAHSDTLVARSTLVASSRLWPLMVRLTVEDERGDEVGDGNKHWLGGVVLARHVVGIQVPVRRHVMRL